MDTKIVARGLLLLLCCAAAVDGDQQGRTTPPSPPLICGSWTVKRILHTSNVQASPDSIKNFLALDVTFFSSEMKFGDRVVEHPSYEVKRMSERDFFDETGIPLKQLDIRGTWVDTVEVLDSAGKSLVAPGTLLFVRNKNAIISTWDGLFFELIRKGKPCSA